MGASVRDTIKAAMEVLSEQKPNEEAGIKVPDETEELDQDEIEGTEEVEESEEEEQDEDSEGQAEDAPSDALPDTQEVFEAYPKSWKASEKPFFEKLPAQVKKEILRREEDRDKFLLKKSNEISQVQQRYKEVENVFESHKDYLTAKKIHPAALINNLLNVEKIMDSDPVHGLQYLASYYGIDLSALAQQAAKNPNARATPEYISLESKLKQIESEMLRQKQIEQDREHKSLQNDVQSFIGEKDSRGNPKHPYIGAVMEDLTKLVPLVKRENPTASGQEVLKAAYEKAIWMNPSVRQMILNQEKLKESNRKKEELKNKTERAKRAGVTISGSPEAAKSSERPSSVRDAIMHAIRVHSN